MVTYLIGTDGTKASKAICEYLEKTIDESDHLEVINIQTDDDDAEAYEDGQDALSMFEEQFGEIATVNTKQYTDRHDATETIVSHADKIGADQIMIALRPHSRTDRLISGSVSYALHKQTKLPITLVPLKEKQRKPEFEKRDVKYMY